MANTQINIRKKFAKYFKDRLGMWDYRRGWLKGNCPMCGGEKKYGVNIDLNRTHCFKCEFTGKPLEVIKEIEGFSDLGKALIYIKAFEDAEYLETPQELLPETQTVLPPEFISIGLGTGRYAQLARSYMESRGFNIREIMLRGIGYCKTGKYQGRVILPYYEAGNLVYFNARQFIGGNKKFDNPTVEEVGVGKSLLIYNIDALQLYKKIYITESATNALTLGDSAIGGGGKAFSVYQISKLINSPAKAFVIILDPDAYLEAIKLALKLCQYKKVKLVKLPSTLRIANKNIKVDVNSIGKSLTLKYIKEFKWVNYSNLIMEKMKYDRELACLV